jgi:hypothetical protein
MSIHSLPHNAKVIHSKLPKASMLNISFLPWRYQVHRNYMHTRGANFAAIWLWRFQIVIRRPWMAGPARQLHPELFEVKP